MKVLFRGGEMFEAEKTITATQIWLSVKSLCLNFHDQHDHFWQRYVPNLFRMLVVMKFHRNLTRTNPIYILTRVSRIWIFTRQFILLTRKTSPIKHWNRVEISTLAAELTFNTTHRRCWLQLVMASSNSNVCNLKVFLVASTIKSHPLPRCSSFAVFSSEFQISNGIIDNVISQEDVQRSSYIYMEFLRKMLSIPPFQRHYWSGRVPRKKLDSQSEMQSILDQLCCSKTKNKTGLQLTLQES